MKILAVRIDEGSKKKKKKGSLHYLEMDLCKIFTTALIKTYVYINKLIFRICLICASYMLISYWQTHSKPVSMDLRLISTSKFLLLLHKVSQLIVVSCHPIQHVLVFNITFFSFLLFFKKINQNLSP